MKFLSSTMNPAIYFQYWEWLLLVLVNAMFPLFLTSTADPTLCPYDVSETSSIFRDQV